MISALGAMPRRFVFVEEPGSVDVMTMFVVVCVPFVVMTVFVTKVGGVCAPLPAIRLATNVPWPSGSLLAVINWLKGGAGR